MNGIKNSIPKTTLSDFMRQNTTIFVDPTVRLLARLKLTPNMLTIAGLLLHIPCAWLLASGRWRLGALVGLFSMLDVLDGALARHLHPNRAGSRWGAFLDSTSDRVAEIILFAGLVSYFTQQGDGASVLVAYAALAGSLMVSYTRARAEGLGFACKIGIFGRFERYLTLFIFGMLRQPMLCVWVIAIGTWLTACQRMLHVYRQSQQDRTQ